MRCPSSPGHGGESRPGSSFWNFLQKTVRPDLLPTGCCEGDGPQISAMAGLYCSPEGRRYEPATLQRGAPYGELWRDGETQAAVRVAQRGGDGLVRLRAREDEPEIACAFRQRQQQLVHLRRDAHIVDVRDAARVVDAVAAAKDAAARNRNHHHPARGRFAPPGGGRLAERMPQQHLLERGFVTGVIEPQRARAKAADRTRGDLEDVDAPLVAAALGVDRTVVQSERGVYVL